MIYIFKEPSMISDDIYSNWLSRTSTQRREQTLRYKFHKDRVLCIASHRLLCYGLCAENAEFCYNEYGKPYLQNGGKHFNITHCDGLAGCVISDFPVGIDAEILAPYPRNVVSRVFTEHEIAQISESDEPDRIFFTLWTLKESYVKALGLGLQFPLHDVEFTLANDGIRCSDASFIFESHTFGHHIVSCCSKEKHQVLAVSLQDLQGERL